MKLQDRITIYNEDGKKLLTTFDGSLTHKLKRALGFGCYANDLIVDAGLADIAEFIIGRYDYISLGTGTTAPTRSDTALESEALTRAQCMGELTTTYYTDDTAQLSAEFMPLSNISITESGVHKNATSSGDIMFARETFAPMSLIADVEYPVVWDIIVMR